MEENTIAYYNQYGESYFESTKKVDMSYCEEQFLSYLGHRSYILDAGCGSGRDSKYFIEKGHDVLSMDASETMCKLAENYIGKEVLRIRFEDLAYNNVFDGIWACASLVHVSRNDIESVLECLYKALRKGGILYASFKYGSGEMFRDGRLFNCYDEKKLEELFTQHALFQIVKMFNTEDVRTNHQNEYWINVIARKP